MTARPLDVRRRVAIIDDDHRQVEINGMLLEQAGFNAVAIAGPFVHPDELVDRVRHVADVALCDHRLQHGRLASFFGAQAVAALFSNRIPAVLVTQYSEQDMDVTIRRWRHAIPAVVPRDEFDADHFLSALDLVERELAGQQRSERRPHRALVNVKDSSQEGGEKVLDVLIPQWNPKRTVRLPVSIDPAALAAAEPGSWFVARINVEAPTSAELFFQDFEAAPEPLGEDLE